MSSQITLSSRVTWLRLYFSTAWRRGFGLNVSQISPNLFLGGQFRPEQWPQLYALGIRAIINLQAEREDQYQGTPPERTLRLLVPDFYPPTIEQLQETVTFVESAHAAGLPVFIHCHAGIGRAPLATAAVLVAQGQSAQRAMAEIAAKRPIIDLNPRQFERLVEWERARGEQRTENKEQGNNPQPESLWND